jgi:hypothetical protein
MAQVLSTQTRHLVDVLLPEWLTTLACRGITLQLEAGESHLREVCRRRSPPLAGK